MPHTNEPCIISTTLIPDSQLNHSLVSISLRQNLRTFCNSRSTDLSALGNQKNLSWLPSLRSVPCIPLGHELSAVCYLLVYDPLPSFIIMLAHTQLKLSVYVYVDHILLLSLTSEPCQGPGSVGAQHESTWYYIHFADEDTKGSVPCPVSCS